MRSMFWQSVLVRRCARSWRKAKASTWVCKLACAEDMGESDASGKVRNVITCRCALPERAAKARAERGESHWEHDDGENEARSERDDDE